MLQHIFKATVFYANSQGFHQDRCAVWLVVVAAAGGGVFLQPKKPLIIFLTLLFVTPISQQAGRTCQEVAKL